MGGLWDLAFFLRSIFPEQAPDFFSPDLHPLMVVRIALLKMFQKPLYYFASRRKDGQANQDKQNPLQNGEKQAENPQNYEKPADNQ
jgi:hypothetical protein